MAFRVDQPAIIMLPMDLDQKSAQLAEQRCGNRLVVHESAAAAIGLDRAPDDKFLARTKQEIIAVEQTSGFR